MNVADCEGARHARWSGHGPRTRRGASPLRDGASAVALPRPSSRLTASSASLDVLAEPELGHELVADDALPVDDEGHPAGNDPERRLHAVERADLAARRRPASVIGQLVLAGELLVRGGRVGADADDLGAGLGEGVVAVAEAARLDGAAGGVVLRIEVEDDGALRPERREGDGLAGRGGQGEIGGLVSDARGSCVSSPGVGCQARGRIAGLGVRAPPARRSNV